MEMDRTSYSLVGRCGLYCGACSIYNCSHDPAFGEKRQRVAEKYNIAPEKVTCQGCMALTDNCWGNDCKIVACLRGKGLPLCIYCEELGAPCSIWQNVCNDYQEQYGNLLSAMERVRAGETDDWLAEMDARMRCPGCHGTICYFEKTCVHCGNQLT
jgi:hypothetical protein